MSRAEKIAIVVTPLVAMATLAIGLQVGARSAVHAAILYGAPRAKGASVFAWQPEQNVCSWQFAQLAGAARASARCSLR